GDAGLLADAARQIGEGKPLSQQFVFGDASGEGHRLKADAGDGIHVLDGAAHNVADLVVVDALHDGGHEDDLHAGGATVLDDAHLGRKQRPPAGAQVNVIADSVELQVEGGQPGRLGLLGEFEIGQLDTVGR